MRLLIGFRAFLKDDRGPTAVEYALMAAAVAGLIVAVVFFLGTGTNRLFKNVAEFQPPAN
jgi:Flp pilus assembly pilin Flp